MKACVFRRSTAFPPNRVSSFEDSYHGLARRLGSDVVADCTSASDAGIGANVMCA